MKLVESVIMNSLFCVILIIATVSNSLLLLVFQRRPGLRTISNRFVINLLITNLVTCWLLIPVLLIDNMWQEPSNWKGGFLKHESLCPITEGLSVGMCAATVFSVLLIGVDQYYAVLDPLRYHSSINTASSVLMIAVSWLLSTGFALAGGLTTSSNENSWYGCGGDEVVRYTLLPEPYQVAFPIAFATFVFSAPFLAICWIYYSIYSAAHQNSQRTRRNGSSAGFNAADILAANDYPDISSSMLNEKPLHPSATKASLKSTSSSIVNSLRRRISNTSLFRYREETRAARISALVIVMALICWFPFTLLLILRSPIFDNGLSYFVKQLGILSLTSSAVASPLIFAHRNRRIHKELCRLFRSSKRTYSFYDHPSKKFLKNKRRAFDLLLTLSDTEDASNSPKKSTVLSYLPKSSRTVSILNKVWIINKSETDKTSPHHHQAGAGDCISLPQVALEVDTSRSSFSSNSSATSTSTQSTHRSTSAASFSDITAIVENGP